ncbi:MAG: hypothetical protein WA990_16900, partial [Rubrobacteraceae bacterium]
LFGGIQPAMPGELGAGMDDGLMDRFLFAEAEIGAEAEERYAVLYRKLSDLILATDEHGDPNPEDICYHHNDILINVRM